MAATWDPANLFQISYEIDNDFTLISCVGEDETRLNRPRCRYSVPEIWYPEIRSQLAKFAAQDPKCISEQELIDLARICLCEETHQYQAELVAQRWLDVVATAAQHHDQLLRKSKEQASIATQLSQLTPNGAEEELREHKIKYTSVLLENYEQRRQIEELETERSTASISLETVKQENQDLRAEVEEASKRKAYTSKYNDMLRKQLEAATKRAQGLDAKVSYIEGLHGSTKAQADRLQEENSSLKAEIARLRQKEGVLSEKHEQALSELSAQRATNIALTNQVQYLKAAERLLRESISACWFHNIYTWVLQIFGFSSPVLSKIQTEEKAQFWV
ncbi:unnamed protein product [Clonostachys rosea f. rosea IK726]|uniref:Uncharacterized protein n=1 Tax=Clonostachys rosea f. rosea IK726 TaxID=1349383 RepID=A0ACA9TY87_BIOOC|nr:unnamed protein product [Clonostachys rosea f. rosea IK726]